MSVVREPSAESADPFGDYTALNRTTPQSQPPTSDDFAPPDYEAPPPASDSGIMGRWLAAGAAKMIGIAAVVAITTGGFGLLRGGVGTDGPPNVPAHVLDACSEAKLVLDPLRIVTGTHIAYEQSGTDARITYEDPGGSTWTCLYETSSGSAIVDGAFE